MANSKVYRQMISDLLNCAELSQESLEDDTLELIQQAEMLLMSDEEDEDGVFFDASDDDGDELELDEA